MTDTLVGAILLLALVAAMFAPYVLDLPHEPIDDVPIAVKVLVVFLLALVIKWRRAP